MIHSSGWESSVQTMRKTNMIRKHNLDSWAQIKKYSIVHSVSYENCHLTSCTVMPCWFFFCILEHSLLIKDLLQSKFQLRSGVSQWVTWEPRGRPKAGRSLTECSGTQSSGYSLGAITTIRNHAQKLLLHDKLALREREGGKEGGREKEGYGEEMEEKSFVFNIVFTGNSYTTGIN